MFNGLVNLVIFLIMWVVCANVGLYGFQLENFSFIMAWGFVSGLFSGLVADSVEDFIKT